MILKKKIIIIINQIKTHKSNCVIIEIYIYIKKKRSFRRDEMYRRRKLKEKYKRT